MNTLSISMLVTLACAGLVPDNAAADEQVWSLRGFGTIGLARSTSADAVFVRELTQPNGSQGNWTTRIDSVLGLQSSWNLDAQWESVIQVVSAQRHDGTFRPQLSWAFLRGEPIAGLTLRAGRLGTEFYMFADARRVGFSLLPVRLPPDHFARMPMYQLDGFDAAYSIPIGADVLKFKVFTGLSSEKIPLDNAVWDFDGSRVRGAFLDLLSGDWQWRLSYAQIQFRSEFPLGELLGPIRAIGSPAAFETADALSVLGRRAAYLSLGMRYDRGPLEVQAILGRNNSEGLLFENMSSGYLLAGYRLSYATPYLGVSAARSKHKPIDLDFSQAIGASASAALKAGVQAAMRGSHIDQRTLFGGLRINLTPTVAAKIQVDRVLGRPGSNANVQRERPSWRGRTTVFSTTLDFTF